jgi:hypothetical protein
MKEQMDARTILFKGENFSLAYDETFFNRNFQDIISKIDKSSIVYYKYTGERSTWFDIDHSFNVLHGFKADKYFHGSNLHKLNPLLFELPPTTFVDRFGYAHPIAARDGLANIFNYVNLIDDSSIIIVRTIDVNGDLVLDFNIDITNAIINLNHLFYPYVMDSPNRIRFNSTTSFYNSNQPSENLIKVFKWQGLLKNAPVKPISRDEEWFEFANDVDENGILIYNTVMYHFERNFTNKKKIKLVDIDMSDYVTFGFNDFELITFTHEDPGITITKLEQHGNNNYAQNFATFIHPNLEAMVVYNGLYHPFTLTNSNKNVNYEVPAVLDSFTDGIVASIQFIY